MCWDSLCVWSFGGGSCGVRVNDEREAGSIGSRETGPSPPGERSGEAHHMGFWHSRRFSKDTRSSFPSDFPLKL